MSALVVFLLIIVLVALLSAIGKWQLARSRRNFPPAGKFVEIEDIKLHYVERGTGVPIVMIHGSDGILQDFTQTIFDAVAREFHAVAFDRPGHGYSQRPASEPVTLAMAARLIHLASLKLTLDRPVIVGHSYGGAVALQYALDYPNDLSALLLLAPGAYADGMPNLDPGRKAMKFLGPLMAHPVFVPLARAMGRSIIDRSYRPNPTLKSYADILREFSSRPEQFRTLADEVVHFRSGLESIIDRYGEITTPTVVIAGDVDPVTLLDRTGRRLAAVIPNAQLTILPGTGHMVHHLRPEAVLSALRTLGTNANPPT